VPGRAENWVRESHSSCWSYYQTGRCVLWLGRGFGAKGVWVALVRCRKRTSTRSRMW
jgi:hypothetical protein